MTAENSCFDSHYPIDLADLADLADLTDLTEDWPVMVTLENVGDY